MTVQEFSEKLNLNILNKGDMSKEITGGYCGDLLSWVMSRAESGQCWFTVMGNINAIAVMVLADCACLVLCENSTLDDNAFERAKTENVTVLCSEKNSYNLSVELGKLL